MPEPHLPHRTQGTHETLTQTHIQSAAGHRPLRRANMATCSFPTAASAYPSPRNVSGEGIGWTVLNPSMPFLGRDCRNAHVVFEGLHSRRTEYHPGGDKRRFGGHVSRVIRTLVGESQAFQR